MATFLRPGLSGGPVSGIATSGGTLVPEADLVGSASILEASDAVAATSVLSTHGAASITEAGDALAATGKILIRGNLSRTEANDTASATGSFTILGFVTITEASDALVSTALKRIRPIFSARFGGGPRGSIRSGVDTRFRIKV